MFKFVLQQVGMTGFRNPCGAVVRASPKRCSHHQKVAPSTALVPHVTSRGLLPEMVATLLEEIAAREINPRVEWSDYRGNHRYVFS